MRIIEKKRQDEINGEVPNILKSYFGTMLLEFPTKGDNDVIECLT